jgi:hypothetical protein
LLDSAGPSLQQLSSQSFTALSEQDMPVRCV